MRWKQMSPRRGARTRHQVMVVGLVAGMVALGAPWIAIRTSTGADGGATWADFSALSFALALASVAAWGATLLTGAMVSRVVSGLQSALALGALWGIVQSVRSGEEVAIRLAGEITGVIGAFRAEDIVWGWNTWAVGIAVGAASAFLISGLLGIAYPGERSSRTKRYEQPGRASHDHPWDDLSDGLDPTAR